MVWGGGALLKPRARTSRSADSSTRGECGWHSSSMHPASSSTSNCSVESVCTRAEAAAAAGAAAAVGAPPARAAGLGSTPLAMSCASSAGEKAARSALLSARGTATSPAASMHAAPSSTSNCACGRPSTSLPAGEGRSTTPSSPSCCSAPGLPSNPRRSSRVSRRAVWVRPSESAQPAACSASRCGGVRLPRM